VDTRVRTIFSVTNGDLADTSLQAGTDVPARAVTVGHLIADLPTGTDWYRFHAR
jgi:hypothetical protein